MTKDKRLVCRASDEQIKAIYRAADLEGVLPSEFIRRAATEEAHRVIDRYSRIRVSMDQADKMLAALDKTND